MKDLFAAIPRLRIFLLFLRHLARIIRLLCNHTVGALFVVHPFYARAATCTCLAHAFRFVLPYGLKQFSLFGGGRFGNARVTYDDYYYGHFLRMMLHLRLFCLKSRRALHKG